LNLLAFDTSTDALSIALGAPLGSAAPLEHHGAGGAHSSASLIPAVLALLAQRGLAVADLDAVVFGCGPGSFTGLRTACAVAQGLAFGAGLPVLPVETLMAVAEQALERTGATEVLALLDARMDEVYAAHYVFGADGRWQRQGPVVLRSPEQLQRPPGAAVAGNVLGPYAGRLDALGPIEAAVPTAAALLRLAPALLAAGQGRPADEALPLYVRDKVAQTTEERAATRSALAQARMAP
jgi:tRNA threonylcarbamoyladenosine biosynthesis protein TsaB